MSSVYFALMQNSYARKVDSNNKWFRIGESNLGMRLFRPLLYPWANPEWNLLQPFSSRTRHIERAPLADLRGIEPSISGLKVRRTNHCSIGPLWGDRRSLNSQPPEPQSGALPVELRPHLQDHKTIQTVSLSIQWQHIFWHSRPDSNRRYPGWEPGVLGQLDDWSVLQKLAGLPGVIVPHGTGYPPCTWTI